MLPWRLHEQGLHRHDTLTTATTTTTATDLHAAR